MNLNLTLLGQMLTFAIFVWFTMKYVWPPMMQALNERKQKIADGLAAAERGKHELDLASHKAIELIREAKEKAAHIIEDSNKRAGQIVDEAKEQARYEGLRLIELAKAEIDRDYQKAKQTLKAQVAAIAIAGAEKILLHNIDQAENSALLDKLITEI